jgi:hypothetical protein
MNIERRTPGWRVTYLPHFQFEGAAWDIPSK